MKVLRAGAAIGDVHELVGGNEARKPIVSVVFGQLRESLRRGVEQPKVSIVRPVVAAAGPRRCAALKQNLGAVGGSVGRAAETIVQPHGRAALDRDRERTRRTIEIALDGTLDECHRLATERSDRRQRKGRVELGELLEVAAISGHRPEVFQPIALALKDDAGAVGSKPTAHIDRRIRSEPNRLSAHRRRAPEIAAPREDNRGSVGRQRRVAGKIDLRRLTNCTKRQREQGEKNGARLAHEGKAALDHE